MNNFKKKILIDLDGVLNEYKGNYDENIFPPAKEGVEEFLEKLCYEFKNCELYLFTTRNLLLSAKWLIKNNLDKFFKEITNIKTSAYLTIDDRAICFKGDYKKLFDEINNFRVWWK